MQKRFFVPCAGVVCLASLSALLAAGCGGSGSPRGEASNSLAASGAATGRAVFRITWPAKTATRLIPQASGSVKIEVRDGDKVLETRIVPRPTDGASSVVEIDDLPAKKLMDVVKTFPGADGSGVAQAEGEAEVEVKANKTIDVPLTLESTIARIDLSPSTEVTLAPGQTQTYVATPRDAKGAQVLIAPGGLQWKTDAPQNVSIDQNGLATSINDSRVKVTVTETESGKSASVLLSVFSDPCTNAAPYNKPSSYLEFRDVPASAAVGDTVTFTVVLHGPALSTINGNDILLNLPGDTVKVARISPDPSAPEGLPRGYYIHPRTSEGDTLYSVSYRQTEDAKNTCRISTLQAILDLYPKKGEYYIYSGFRVSTP